IPIHEGPRYRVADLTLEGNSKFPASTLKPLLDLKPGDYYDEKKVQEAFTKWGDLYGTVGFFEMTPRREFERVPTAPDAQAKLNLTLRIIEGKQFYINRISFVGNTNTRDKVIRRELRLFENDVFNTEALKYSIRRLNQLGFFKPIEDQKSIIV